VCLIIAEPCCARSTILNVRMTDVISDALAKEDPSYCVLPYPDVCVCNNL